MKAETTHTVGRTPDLEHDDLGFLRSKGTKTKILRKESKKIGITYLKIIQIEITFEEKYITLTICQCNVHDTLDSMKIRVDHPTYFKRKRKS